MCGTEAVARNAVQRRTRAFDGFVLVLERATAAVHLFYAPEPSGIAELAPVPLDVVPTVHARDFLVATNCVLLRAAVAFAAPSRAVLEETVQQWRARLSADSDSGAPDELFFQIASGRTVFSSDGVDVTGGRTSTGRTLRELLVPPSSTSGKKKTVKSSTTAKKKTMRQSSAVLEAWNDDNHDTGDNAVDNSRAGHLRTLEYGDIANVEVLRSLAPLGGEGGAAPALTLSLAGNGTDSEVELRADVLVLVSTDATVADALALVRDELRTQVRLRVVGADDGSFAR